MVSNVPNRGAFWQQIRIIVCHTMLILASVVLLALYFPLLSSELRKMQMPPATVQADEDNPATTYSLSFLMGLFFVCIFTVMTVWVWYVGTYARNVYRQLKAYPLELRDRYNPTEPSMVWNAVTGVRYVPAAAGRGTYMPLLDNDWDASVEEEEENRNDEEDDFGVVVNH